MFAPALSVHRYLPAIWNEEEEEDPNEEWDNESYEDEEPETPITRSSGVMILFALFTISTKVVHNTDSAH